MISLKNLFEKQRYYLLTQFQKYSVIDSEQKRFHEKNSHCGQHVSSHREVSDWILFYGKRE